MQQKLPFYKSLRFRLGLIFNSLLFVCVSVIVYSLYKNAKTELDKSFGLQLSSSANTILQKTEINPLSVPIPKSGEYFRITYNNGVETTVLINHFPKNSSDSTKWRSISVQKNPENGGVIKVDLVLSAEQYQDSVDKLRRLLYIYLPIAFLVAFLSGYLLTGFYLRPHRRIINNANKVDLDHITLLDKPTSQDEFYQLTDSLNRMLQRIDEQVKQQTMFFTTASHELRTPISNMLTELQISDRNQMSESTRKLLDNQEQEVKRMKELVNNFLLMSQIESGNLNANFSEINLADLILSVTENFSQQVLQNRQKFKIEMQPLDADFGIFADKNQVEVVVNNLISNAIKYAKSDSLISVHIFQNKKIGMSITNVSDKAIINPENLKQQFLRDAFHKDGFGLGLWIADNLMCKNNGELSLKIKENMFVASIEFDTDSNPKINQL